jgi:hypothetical protein
MSSNVLIPAFCITFALGFISLGCQIYVSRQLSKAGAKINLPIGKRSWITPFIQGWQNAKQLAIVDVMYFWTAIIGLTFFGMIITVFALIAANPSP